jgi:integrase
MIVRGALAPLLPPRYARILARARDRPGRICKQRIGTAQVHTLRHTFARLLEDTGAKVSFIQAKLGHESLATTGRYLAALKADKNTHGDELAALMGLG